MHIFPSNCTYFVASLSLCINSAFLPPSQEPTLRALRVNRRLKMKNLSFHFQAPLQLQLPSHYHFLLPMHDSILHPLSSDWLTTLIKKLNGTPLLCRFSNYNSVEKHIAFFALFVIKGFNYVILFA